MMKFLNSGYLCGFVFAIVAVVWYMFGVPWAIGCGNPFALFIAIGTLVLPFALLILYIWECIRQ